MAKQFSHVPGKYGAPMGRPEIMKDPTAKVSLFRVRFVDSDYDDGGAYWGGGRDSQPIYCARAEGVQLFRRADNREDAKTQILRGYPGLSFYR